MDRSREGSADSVGYVMEDRALAASTALLSPGEGFGEPPPRTIRRRRAKQHGLTGRLVFTIAAASFGSAFQHGYNTGVVNAPTELIEEWILDVKRNRSLADGESPGEVSQSTVTLIYSIFVAMFCVGGMLGGSIVGVVADRIGRKHGLLYNNFFVFIAVLCEGCSKWMSSYELLILGRFFIGLNSGLNAGLVPVYLAEVAPLSLRGAVGTVYQLIITISIMLSQIFGLESLLGTESSWPILFVLTIFPAIFQLCTFPFCPESPKHLLQSTKNELLARQSLVWLRSTLDVQDEMDEMKQEMNENSAVNSRVTLRELTSSPSLRVPLIISGMLMVAQQFSGINAAMYYSTKTFRLALSETWAQRATLGVGVVNVLMTLVSLFLVDLSGRKTLLLIGFIGMFFSTLLITFSLVHAASIVFLAYMSVLGMILFVVFFSVGPGSIPWFITSELFAQSARPAATAVAVVVNWLANFIVGLGFLPLSSSLGPYVFLIFAALQSFFVIFIYKKVPETKNKTTEEITAMFRQATYQ